MREGKHPREQRKFTAAVLSHDSDVVLTQDNAQCLPFAQIVGSVGFHCFFLAADYYFLVVPEVEVCRVLHSSRRAIVGLEYVHKWQSNIIVGIVSPLFGSFEASKRLY